MSLQGISDEVIEHARRVKGVSADWNVDWCANECGDVVFYPPGAQEQAAAQGTPFILCCSSACLARVLRQRG